jgi:hypothetical protein
MVEKLCAEALAARNVMMTAETATVRKDKTNMTPLALNPRRRL